MFVYVEPGGYQDHATGSKKPQILRCGECATYIICSVMNKGPMGVKSPGDSL